MRSIELVQMPRRSRARTAIVSAILVTNCSAQIDPTTNYPASICSGNGLQHSNSDQRCVCFQGFTGPECQLRVCPKGLAWHDAASAVDTAHAQVRCCSKSYLFVNNMPKMYNTSARSTAIGSHMFNITFSSYKLAGCKCL